MVYAVSTGFGCIVYTIPQGTPPDDTAATGVPGGDYQSPCG